MNLTIRLLGVEVFAICTDSDAPSPAPDAEHEGDATAMPMGFVARMDRPHEAETPDRDW